MHLSNKINTLLQIADNALIIGHRLSEWCGHGPILEQDIALTNMSLDHLGQARSLYQYAADLYNTLPAAQKNQLFTSTALQTKVSAAQTIQEDDLAFLRDAWDFKNVLLVEQTNKDWAYTIARAFFYDAFNYLYYTALLQSNHETIAAIAQKSLKEVTYHLRWSSEWVIRLGDGTTHSHHKMQQAINDLWPFTGELFITSPADHAALADGYGANIAALKSAWLQRVSNILTEATLQVPKTTWMQQGGKVGTHTEHLGFVLAELQFMQRAYPNMQW